MSEDRPAVFVIDDDPSMRRSLETLLRQGSVSRSSSSPGTATFR